MSRPPWQRGTFASGEFGSRGRDSNDPDSNDFDSDDFESDDFESDDFGGAKAGARQRPRARVLPAPPAALALVVVGVLAVVVASVFMISDGSADVPTVAFPESAGPTATSTSGRAVAGAAVSTRPTAGGEVAAPAAKLVVSVVGLVRRPGLVTLAPQARVADAIAAAGGARAEADVVSLNLARPLRDGDQVIVGVAPGEGRTPIRSAVIGANDQLGTPAPGGDPSRPPGTESAAPPAGKVNLNSATEAELDALPGVGPVTAAAIIAWRDQHGRFASVDQLAEVDGIGPGRLAKLRDRVTV